MIDIGRFLVDPHAPDRQSYEIIGDGRYVFVTGGVNGKSADDTAIGNLMDASEQTDRVLTLVRLDETMEVIAVAEGGIGRRA